MGINIDRLAAQIVSNLEGYTTEVIDGIDKSRKQIVKKAVKALQSDSPAKTGVYQKSWSSKDEKFSGQTGTSAIHNKKHYRRTHLLENGHYTRNGGWTVGKSHIRPVEETVIEEFESAVERVIRNASR